MSAKRSAALAALESYADEILAACAERMAERRASGQLDECWGPDWDDDLAEAAAVGDGPAVAADRFLRRVDNVGPAGVYEEVCWEAASLGAIREAAARLRSGI